MYLYQPCLLAMALHIWACENVNGKQHILRGLFPLAILAVSEIELSFHDVQIYPAALLLPLYFLLRSHRSIVWEEVLTAVLLGGFVCWRISDAWPLFEGIIPLCGLLFLIPVKLFCRDRENRFFACALISLVYEWFFCLKEYMLFSYCVIRIGSRDSLSLGAASICIYGLSEQIWKYACTKRKQAISISN